MSFVFFPFCCSIFNKETLTSHCCDCIDNDQESELSYPICWHCDFNTEFRIVNRPIERVVGQQEIHDKQANNWDSKPDIRVKWLSKRLSNNKSKSHKTILINWNEVKSLLKMRTNKTDLFYCIFWWSNFIRESFIFWVIPALICQKIICENLWE